MSVVVPSTEERPRDRARRRRGQAADAADRRPGQARGAVRRHLPADRLRAVQRRQLRLPQGRRAHAVQVAQPRPAHHDDVADVDPARQLRDAGAGAAAGRQALVPRQRRRDLPDAQPAHRRASPTSSSWSAPTTSTGWTSRRWSTSTSRPAPRARSRRSASRSSWPTSSASSTSTRRRPRRSGRSWRSRRTRSGCPTRPREVLASMGNYVFDADALLDAVTRDAQRERSKHDMGGDIVPWFVDRSESAVYDFKDNDVPGSNDRDRDYWRDVGTMRLLLRGAHGPHRAAAGLQPLQHAVADLHQLRATTAGQARRGRQGHADHDVQLDPLAGRGRDWRHGEQVGALAVVPRRVRRRGLRLGAALGRARARRGRSCATPSSTRTSSCRRACEIGVDPVADEKRGFVVEDGLTVLAKEPGGAVGVTASPDPSRAGQVAEPQDLVDVPKLVTAYYTERAGPRRRRPAGRVRHQRAPRLLAEDGVQRDAHPGHHPGDLRLPPRAGVRRPAVRRRATPTASPSRRGAPRWRCSSPTTSPCWSTTAAATRRRRRSRTRSSAPTAARTARRAAGSPTASSSRRRTTRPPTAGSSTTLRTVVRPTPTRRR